LPGIGNAPSGNGVVAPIKFDERFDEVFSPKLRRVNVPILKRLQLCVGQPCFSANDVCPNYFWNVNLGGRGFTALRACGLHVTQALSHVTSLLSSPSEILCHAFTFSSSCLKHAFLYDDFLFNVQIRFEGVGYLFQDGLPSLFLEQDFFWDAFGNLLQSGSILKALVQLVSV
jgi:hypothetical protein